MTRDKLRDVIQGQAIAILIVAAMVLMRWLVEEWLAYESPLLLFMLAVVAAAYYGGLWPGLTAMVLSVLADNFFFVEPEGAFAFTNPSEHVRAAIFVFVGASVSGLCEALHRSRRRVERKNFQLGREMRERQQAEATRRESESRLQFALDAAGMVHWDWNLADGSSEPTIPAQRLLGPAAGNAQSLLELVHPADWDRVQAAIEQARHSETPYELEYRLATASGEIRWVVDRARWQNDPQTGQPHLTGVCIDITDRKRAVLALRDSEARFRHLADSMPQIVYALDRDGQATYVNRQWQMYTGLETMTAELLGQIVHPGDAEAFRISWSAAFAAQQPFGASFRLRRASDGAYRWFLTRTIPQRNEAGEIAQWFGTSTDIDDQKQAEAKLREADRRKDEFLATLAHELRNPLAPIRNAVQLLNLSPAADSLIEMARDTIGRQIEQLVRLVDDLLDVSRITSDKLQLRKAPTALADIMRIALETSQPLIDASDHELAVELPSETLTIDGDQARLAQVFSNLLNNAAKYSPPGSHIRLVAQRHGSEIEVRVRDDGLGIAPDVLPHVFNMFTQAERSLGRSQGGMGIGLTLVKRLVEMHGGTVEAHSAGQGQGSEFRVRLPLLIVPARPRIPLDQPPAAAPAAPATRRKILVVDDNQDAAATLAMLLRSLGNEVQTAHDGLEAVAAAERFQPEVALLDIGLPKLNGHDAARRIRQLPGGGEITLVALTGWGQDEDRRLSQEAGFDQHLVKPIDLATIRKLLAGLARQTA